jgi:hypothetical protein
LILTEYEGETVVIVKYFISTSDENMKLILLVGGMMKKEDIING